jgi:hypothetical protein
MNELPIPGWARQPILWDLEDFRLPRDSDSSTGVITTAVKKIFSVTGAPPQWQMQGNNAASGTANLNDEFGHNGTWLFTTDPTSGRQLWIGNTAGLGTFATGVIRPNSVVRWEWWVKIPTITSISVGFGVNDEWSAGFGASDYSALVLNTTVGSNWLALTDNTGSAAQSTTGPAATTGWVKLSAQFRNMNFSSNTGEVDYYVDEVLFASHTIVPQNTLILGGFLSTLTAGARSFHADRAALWVDGETMTG